MVQQQCSIWGFNLQLWGYKVQSSIMLPSCSTAALNGEQNLILSKARIDKCLD
uniref:Uncharacterized protein n=1 Tax=Anguilla anguilla TaxID=7936 RepID=A0A0E9XBS3_ANGAN